MKSKGTIFILFQSGHGRMLIKFDASELNIPRYPPLLNEGTTINFRGDVKKTLEMEVTNNCYHKNFKRQALKEFKESLK